MVLPQSLRPPIIFPPFQGGSFEVFMEIKEYASIIKRVKQEADDQDFWNPHRFKVMGVLLKIYACYLGKDDPTTIGFDLDELADEDIEVSEENELFLEARKIYLMFKGLSTQGILNFIGDILKNEDRDGSLYVWADMETIDALKQSDLFGKMWSFYSASE